MCTAPAAVGSSRGMVTRRAGDREADRGAADCLPAVGVACTVGPVPPRVERLSRSAETARARTRACAGPPALELRGAVVPQCVHR